MKRFSCPTYVLIPLMCLSAQGDHLVSIQSVPSSPCMYVLIPSDLCHLPGWSKCWRGAAQRHFHLCHLSCTNSGERITVECTALSVCLIEELLSKLCAQKWAPQVFTSFCSWRHRPFTGRSKLSPMETLRRTVAQLCPLVLPQRQKRGTERGPTQLAHVCSISMFISNQKNSTSFPSALSLTWLLTAILFCVIPSLCVCLLSVCVCQ